VKKTITMIMVLALAAILAVAQDKPAAQQKAAPVAAQQPSTDPIVVAAGDISIRQSEFENALKTLPPEYQQFAAGPGKKQFAEDYLRMKMLASEGIKNNLDKDPEVVRSLNLMKENLVANAQLNRLEKTITLTDADLQKVYDAKKSEFEQVHARHVLIAFKGSPAAQAGKKELTDEEAKAKAEEVKKKLIAGAKWEDVAKADSDDVASGARGGELGAFGRGAMVEEFEKAAFDAKVGEVIGPVKTQFGYHVVKVDSHTSQPFAEVKANLERTERQKRLKAMLDEMKTKASATFNEAYFNPPPPPTAVKMDAAPTATKPADTKKKQ
jgi:peptidyl-prolyl cis-trans isomerase C